MKIQVLGSGCQTCKALHLLTQKAVNELGYKETVDYVTDVNKIIELGIMQSPVLTVNEKPVMVGFVPDIERIKKAITSEIIDENTEKKCNCGESC